MTRPNVLFIMCDQLKATTLSVYGNRVCNTPSLERLASQGVTFENAITPHPLCVPARTAIMASRYPHQLGTRRNETLMPAGVAHVYGVWKDAGYTTGLIGKNHCFDREEDIDLIDVRGELWHRGLLDESTLKGMEWVRPTDKVREAEIIRENIPRQSPRIAHAISDFPEEDYGTAVITAQTEHYLESHATQNNRGENPFALWVSYPDPHEPYEAVRRYADMFPLESVDLPPSRENEFDDSAPERNSVLHEILGLSDDSEEDIRRAISVYYAMTRFVDDGIGRILDTLERTGLKDNTIIVFTADHGDFMGEHDMIVKGGVFYDCLVRVPLIVSWPGQVAQGVRDDSMVSTIDIVPTLLELQGIDAPPEIHGESLPTVTSATPRDAAFSEYGSGGPPFTAADLELMPRPYGYETLIGSLQWREAEGDRRMVRTTHWKYVHDPMAGPDQDELYDLESDPAELTNVASDPRNAAVVAEMRERLEVWRSETGSGPDVPMPTQEHYTPGGYFGPRVRH
ncbi:MAG: sulfatase-like hydrolase/transferase [Chloroflexi bacterium]|jgi:arylsulfatase|nr:sulfatase-like hydrolase/transferase [Chloroflexota bacterium]MBT4073199.1 sulfatase-like hydrolase/transferase [Chloroflexota bacterium]MBT4515095.1 sulfatase-like hydrolase/transferase [Chloroflexota bacterium]MBT6681398.1 sulfatase-like hydrolase/transferase [Chloroflexota bacterium]